MTTDFVAKATVDIDSSTRGHLGCSRRPGSGREVHVRGVDSDWEEGSEITWTGEWKGKTFQDKGEILEVEPKRLLHYRPMSGEPNRPENYHTVTIELDDGNGETTVTLTQDNTDSEKAREHSEANWQTMLDGLKKHVEST